MTEHTPTTEEVANDYECADDEETYSRDVYQVRDKRRQAFYRWLDAHDAEEEARALDDAADAINRDFQALPSWNESWKAGERNEDWMSGGTRMVIDTIDWLRARAAAARGAAKEEN